MRDKIEDALKTMDASTGGKYKFHSPEAVQLLLGTALHESGGFKYREQTGGGPAKGLMQMEPFTHDDTWKNWIANRPDIEQAMRRMFTPAGEKLNKDRLSKDDAYAIAMARIKYYRRKGYTAEKPLPDVDDIEGQAKYWAKEYNSRQPPSRYVQDWKNYTQ